MDPVAAIACALEPAGFDVVHAFDPLVVAAEPGLAGLATGTLGILIAHTRALWPRFLAALAADPGLAGEADPLDRYSERVIAPYGRAYFAHRAEPTGYLPFQRLAVAAGLGVLSPTHLVVHPIYGPWIGLRAALIFDGPAPPAVPSSQVAPCGCDVACHVAFARAEATPDDWRAWLAVRDACPVGRAWRYSDNQLAYHYTKDKRYLR